MIISASRRTDIPNYYSEWFYNRIKEGFVYVRNPVNIHQVSRVTLSPEEVDCIVFWTKNPEPMLERLDELAAYEYYFQFTLTGYGRDVERNVPHKRERVIPIFQKLSERIGKQRVIWRYDPVMFTRIYTPEYHFRAFEQIASGLEGFTEKCVISFVDIYGKNRKNMDMLGAYELKEKELLEFAAYLSRIAGEKGLEICSCAEKMDFSKYGIGHNSCIDKVLIERMTNRKLKAGKDKNQRKECGCVESVDIGAYHTCKSGCKYCYASYSGESAGANDGKYEPASPMLCGVVGKEDKITERRTKS